MKILKQEGGSIAPLGIGLIIFSMAMMLSIVSATSLFIFQKRLTNLAESAALHAVQTGETAAEFVRQVGEGNFQNLRISNSTLQDGLTTEVRACALWRSIFENGAPAMFGDVGAVEICSHAAARAQN